MEIQWALVVHGLVTLLVVLSLLCGHWPIFQGTFIERIQYFITSGAYDYFLHFLICLYGAVALGFILAGELKKRRVIYILTVYYGVENSFSSLFPYIIQWLLSSYNTQILLIMFLAIVSLLLAGFFGYHAHLCLTNTTTNETFKWQDYISWKRKLNEAKSSAAALKASIQAVTGESNPPKSKWRAFFRRSPPQNEEVVVKNNVYDQGIAKIKPEDLEKLKKELIKKQKGAPNGDNQQSSSLVGAEDLHIEAPVSVTSPGAEGSASRVDADSISSIGPLAKHINFNDPLTNIQADPIPLGMLIRVRLRTLQKEASQVKKKIAKAKRRLLKMKKNFEIVSIELKGLRVRTWPTTQAYLAERNRLQEECKRLAKLMGEKTWSFTAKIAQLHSELRVAWELVWEQPSEPNKLVEIIKREATEEITYLQNQLHYIEE
ncbi:hypothetical protein COCNU_01G017040 [Cocos nucifera]|uniref:Uncharacterized protein n=1 Tax=Cocos nucifera TaxID=13894 RepID=A0A8K0HX09_COCNU|nr:hypothetical protein COCNU_01G017040 [Cocos nucifera]